MARFCLIDYETQSACDLKKSGAWVYAEHPSTEIICLGFITEDAEPHVLTPDDFYCDEGWGPWSEVLHRMAKDPDCYFVAHNVMFEKCIWRNIMMPVYGWPDIPNDRWHDILASCAMKSLPLKLERAASALRLSQQKDTEGTKITLSLSRVNKKTGNYG